MGQVHFGDDRLLLSLHAADEKNRQGAEILLRGDLADDLRQWFTDLLERLQSEAKRFSAPTIPVQLPFDEALFDVPDKLSKIFKRDLNAAGIADVDERGRRLDVHALRHTFGTLLSKGGVAPRTAQAAMRHGKIDLTMNVYTDESMLGVGEALNVLPSLPVGRAAMTAEKMQVTGTFGKDAGQFAPKFAPTAGQSGIFLSPAGKTSSAGPTNGAATTLDATSSPDKAKHPLAMKGSGCRGVDATGFEPVTPSVSSWCSSQLS